MKNFLPYTLLILYLSGCSGEEQVPEKISVSYITNVINEALDTSSAAVNILAGLIEPGKTPGKNYNSLKVDSVIHRSGKIYYYVLLEYPDPEHNRFAVYDSAMTLYLLDKSLNGILSAEEVNLDGRKYIRVNEGYISKEEITLTRLSLFRIDSNAVKFVLRTYTKLASPEVEYFQEVKGINNDSIITVMSSSDEWALNNSPDFFIYDSSGEKYRSRENIFDNFVSEEIKRYPGTAE
jgi:hypothetical protein